MSRQWPWLALAGLGMFHGVNPAMGWLFAVALGLHRASRAVVLLALVPIAFGHALAIGLVVALVVALGVAVEPAFLRVAGGLALVGWGVYHRFYGRRHRIRVGMRTGYTGLVLWSFLMASAHGAGLMLVPVLLPLELAGGHAHGPMPEGSLGVALAAVAVHTLAMLIATGAVAVVVYEWVGVAFLRRGWINLDLLWTIALIATGVLLLVAALMGAFPLDRPPSRPILDVFGWEQGLMTASSRKPRRREPATKTPSYIFAPDITASVASRAIRLTGTRWQSTDRVVCDRPDHAPQVSTFPGLSTCSVVQGL